MGAAAGDFLLEVVFKDHDYYRVDGSNIYMNLPVSQWDLEQGTKINIPSPNSRMGSITMTIPENSQQGAKDSGLNN